jgi:hypothetical protein
MQQWLHLLQAGSGLLTLAAALINLTTALINRWHTLRERPTNDTEN